MDRRDVDSSATAAALERIASLTRKLMVHCSARLRVEPSDLRVVGSGVLDGLDVGGADAGADSGVVLAHFAAADKSFELRMEYRRSNEAENAVYIAGLALELLAGLIQWNSRLRICGRGVPGSTAAAGAEAIAEAVVQLFEARLLRRSSGDVWDTTGRAQLKAQLRDMATSGEPMRFCLPAFPFKSPNRDSKVLGELPDMGELLALRRLESFCAAVQRVYAPGAALLVISDGGVYADILGVAESVVQRYRQRVRQMLGVGPCSRVLFVDFEDLFVGTASVDGRRDNMLSLFDAPYDLRTDEDLRRVFIGFKKFVREDLSVSARAAEDIARRMVARNVAYRGFTSTLFGDYVRLSIHPSCNGVKFGVHLVSADSAGTPWHNVPMQRQDGSWVLVRLVEARRLGCVLATDQPTGLPYFMQSESKVD